MFLAGVRYYNFGPVSPMACQMRQKRGAVSTVTGVGHNTRRGRNRAMAKKITWWQAAEILGFSAGRRHRGGGSGQRVAGTKSGGTAAEVEREALEERDRL